MNGEERRERFVCFFMFFEFYVLGIFEIGMLVLGDWVGMLVGVLRVLGFVYLRCVCRKLRCYNCVVVIGIEIFWLEG